ncbi:hypothetical protein LHZ62_000647 [Escherichia coli]|nr:hypothetical protein [Escherichia coli]
MADRSAWIEVTTAYRALDAVLHGPPQINAMDLPFVFWRPTQVTSPSVVLISGSLPRKELRSEDKLNLHIFWSTLSEL